MNKNPRHQSADMYSVPFPEAGDRVPSSESRRDGGFSEVSALSRTLQNNSFAPESFFIAFKMNKSANCSPLSLPTPVTALMPRDHTAMRLPIATTSPLSTITTSPYDTSSAPLNSTHVHPTHLDQLDEDLEDFHLDAMSSPAWVDSLITTIGNVVPETRPSCMYGEHLLAALCRNGTPLAEVELSQDNLTASSSGSPPPFLRIESDIDNGYDSESVIRPQVQILEDAIPSCVAGIDELDLIEIEGRITSVNREDLDWMRYLSLHSYQSGFRRIPRDELGWHEGEKELISVRLESQARNQLRKGDSAAQAISFPTSNKRVEKRRITLDEMETEEQFSQLSCSLESANWCKSKCHQPSKRHVGGAFPSVETASAPACLISALLQEALQAPMERKYNRERATCRGVLCNDESTRSKIGPASNNIKRHVSFSETVSVVEGSRRHSLPLVHETAVADVAEDFGTLSLKARVSRVQTPKLRSRKWRNHAVHNRDQARLQVPPTINWTLPHSFPEEDGNADSLVYPDDQSCGGILNWAQGLFACFTSGEVTSTETHSSAVTVTTPLCSIPSMTYGSTSTVDSRSLFKGLFEDESDGEDFGRNASVLHRRTELQWSDEDSSDGSESD
ncbi:hypothetical protein BJ741DRAFT_588191 [Chytriomyces cf. hyalinus JEL632]|nr:hypothetical protein BJ741DRAFT_588191 [Chytriomyces cf. hyalinus JEL632]